MNKLNLDLCSTLISYIQGYQLNFNNCNQIIGTLSDIPPGQIWKGWLPIKRK